MNIKKFDPNSANEQEWKDYRVFLKELTRKETENIYDDETLLENVFNELKIKTSNLNEKINFFMVYDSNNKVVSCIQLSYYNENSPSYQTNKFFASAGLEILHGAVTKVLAIYILTFIKEFLEKNGKQKLDIKTNSKELKDLLKKQDFNVSFSADYNTLNGNLDLEKRNKAVEISLEDIEAFLENNIGTKN